MARNQHSSKYLKRREEIIANLGQMSKAAIATHIAHLETEVKKSEEAQLELRKVISKYQRILGRLSSILTASTYQYKSGIYYGKEGRELPFDYKIAFNNCRVVIADYYEDLKLCNPAGYVGANADKLSRGPQSKLSKLRSSKEAVK